MEKVPKKKAPRALNQPRVLLALLCAAALLGAGVYFLQPAPAVPVLPPQAEAFYLLHRPAQEIASIAVFPREGAAYRLVNGENGFVLLGRENEALRDWFQEDLLSISSALQAADVAADTMSQALSLQDFGLASPWVTVRVTYRDGEETELRFGDLTPDDSPQRYCLLTGDSRVFTVMSEESRVFFYEMDYLRAFEQPNINASLLDRIDISGETVFGAYYTASGWQMDAPFSYPLAPARTDALLENIGAMAFEALLGDADSLNLSDYGLDPPALTVTLTQGPTWITGQTEAGETVSVPVPQKEYTLQIGAETGKSGVYLRWEDRVYKASNFLLGFWKQWNTESLLLRQPVNLLINDLSRVSLDCGAVHAAYEVRMVESLLANNQIATDEYGNMLYDCAVRRAGETADMDAEAFLDWYIRLASLAPAGELPPGYAPQGECRARIVLANDRLTRVIEFYPWDALHDAVAVDGVALYYVENAWLDRVLDAP